MRKNKKMYMTALAMAVALPAVVAPMAQEASASTVQFKDISKTSPYYEAVTEMVSKGIIMGYNDGTYKPQVEITRVQVAMLLARALPLEPVREAKTFKDVPKTYKHYDAIRKVQQAGIIDGAGNGNFNPEATLTRSQMAKILAIGFNLEVKADYDFPDVPTSHWANKHVRALYSNGITVGNNGMYEPDESVTRGQYAFFMHRLMNLDPNFEAKPIPKPEKPTPPVVKPEQPKPEKPVDPPVTKPVEPSKPSVDTGLVTDKYPDLADVPKPPGYVAGKTEKTNDDKAVTIAKEKGFVYTGGFSVRYMEENDPRIKRHAQALKITENQLKSSVNQAVTSGDLVVEDNYVMYYNYKTASVVYNSK